LAHIDPLGTILLPIFLFIVSRGQFVFGAARPVPINYLMLNNPKKNIIWIGLAGPVANILLAIVSSLLLKTLPQLTLLSVLLRNFILINVILGVFNLIPIPPLDGSRILMGLLPEGLSRLYAKIEPFGFFIIMLFIFLGLFEVVIWPLVKLIIQFLGI
jgi:Zn-dependent protease